MNQFYRCGFQTLSRPPSAIDSNSQIANYRVTRDKSAMGLDCERAQALLWSGAANTGEIDRWLARE